MDTLSHIVWGQMLLKKPDIFPAIAIATNLPDILGGAPYWIYCTRLQLRDVVHSRKNKTRRYRAVRYIPLPYKYHEHAFLLTHSLVSWAIFSWILYIFWPQMTILSLAYLLHIILDIPTHCGRWALRPFFPFSDFAVKGQYFWQRHVVVLNIVGLILLRYLKIF